MRKKALATAALAAFCVMLAACDAVRTEENEGEKAYRQKLVDAEPLIDRGLSALRRADDASLSSEERAGARAQLGQAICPSFSALKVELRAQHEQVYNALERPFTIPASWEALNAWCEEGQ